MGQVVGIEFIEGSEYAVWPRGSIERKQTVTFSIKAWQGLGGQAANSSGAMKYLLKQLEELASNRDQQPVYIQWTATADPAALLNASELHDGWYIIDDLEPDYSRNVITGLVQCRMTVTEVAAAAPRSVRLAYTGGQLTSTFTGSGKNLLSLPLGSTALEASFNRTGAEGSIPGIYGPNASPEPTVLSATIANIFKGGVHVYDTINTGSNPVPTSGGTFVNANWVEVFWTDHDFQGDCVVTNGLQLLLFQAATAHIATLYLWNIGAATANWFNYGTLDAQDNAGNAATLRSYALRRVGFFECALEPQVSTSGGNASLDPIRLQAGRYDVRADVVPQTQASTTNLSLILTLAFTPKIIGNSLNAADVTLSDTSPAASADFGYAEAYLNSTSNPFIVGFLYQNPPGGSQPFDAGNVATVGLGDTTSLAINARRAYGFYAVPYGVNASYSPANLQLLATAMTTVGTTTTAADAASSGGTVVRAQGNQPPTATGVSTTETATGLQNGDTYTPSFRARCSLANASAKVSLAGNTGTGAVVGNTFRWAQVAVPVTSTGSATRQFILAEEIYLTTVSNPQAAYGFTAPAHYYRLGEASGTTANDVMGAAGNGTYVASPTLGVTGIGQNTDKAVTFNGTTQLVSAIPITGLNTGAGAILTLEAWVNIASNPASTRAFISYGDANVTNGSVWMGVDSTGHPVFSAGSAVLTDASTITTAAWHHVVGTCDGTNARLYVDGSLTNGPTACTLAIPTTAATGRIAARNNNATNDIFFPGSVDEAAFYAVALTQAQVTAHNTAGSVATYLHLDELALLPATRTNNNGPQDVWQQWMYDRSLRLVR